MGFTRARFEGDPAVKAEWGSVCRWTMAMPRRVQEVLPHVAGDYKAIGLVEGHPVYERTSADGVGAMIGLDTIQCLDSSSCLLYVGCVYSRCSFSNVSSECYSLCRNSERFSAARGSFYVGRDV